LIKRFLYIVLLFSGMCLFPCMAFTQTESTEPLAIQYYQNGEFDKAAELFEVLYNSRPDPRYYSYLYDCLLQIGDYKKTEKFLVKQVKKYPDDLKFLVDLGYVYVKSGDENAAKKQFELAIKNVYPDYESYIDLSNAFLLRQQSEYAVKTLEKGKKSIDQSYLLNVPLAEVFIKQGDFTSALGEYLDLLDISGEYLVPVENLLQDLLSEDPDNTKNELFRTELLTKIKKFPDRTRYSELLLWYFIQQREFDAAFIQARSLDKKLNEEGSRVYSLGKMAVTNQAWDAAIECFQYIISQGESNPYWFSARIDIMDTRYQKITKSYTYTHEDILQLEKEYIAALDELGRNAQTLQLMSNLAHLQAFYLDNVPDATKLLDQAISMPGAKPINIAACKLELADILLMSGEVWEATLLYSQVDLAFKNDPIGAEAKLRNARLSFYIGEFGWAKAQLDVLKAATSKLIANDAMQLSLLISDNIGEDSSTTALELYSKADLLLFQNKEELALQTLDSITMLDLYHPIFDEVLYKKAEIMLRERNYAEADSLLVKLYNFYPDDILGDDALFKLAELQETIFGNKDKAMELYKELLEKYPGSVLVVEARKRYRTLRGDKVNP
jgi:TolA-binding protein